MIMDINTFIESLKIKVLENESLSFLINESSITMDENSNKFLCINDISYSLNSELTLNSICKILGITKKFDDRNDSEMGENIYSYHLPKLATNKGLERVLYYTRTETGELLVRDIVSSKSICVDLLTILNLLQENIDVDFNYISFLDNPYDPFSDSFCFKLSSLETVNIEGDIFSKSIIVSGSELGKGKLLISPILEFSENGISYFITLGNSHHDFYLNIPYKESKKGPPFLSQVKECFQSINTLYSDNDNITSIFAPLFEKQITFSEMQTYIEVWSLFKGYPKKLTKLFMESNVDSYVLLCENEDSKTNHYLFMKQLLKDAQENFKIKPFLSYSKFSIQRFGVSSAC